MGPRLSRRTLLADTAAGAAAALTRFPVPAVAQAAPFKLGLLTVKTGPLAAASIHLEHGVLPYRNQTNYTLRRFEIRFFRARRAGEPAPSHARAQPIIS